MVGSERVKVNKKLIGQTNITKYESVHQMSNLILSLFNLSLVNLSTVVITFYYFASASSNNHLD